MSTANLRPRDQILSEIQSRYSKILSCEWMPGDASNRFYGRIKVSDSPESKILMVMNAPEAFKSEEATGADESKIRELPFVTVGRRLESEGVRVPHIDFVDPQSSFMVLEDLGDELLYDRRQKEKAIEWYKLALKTLAKFQRITPFEPAKSRSFTLDLLKWEAEHFVEYAIEKSDKKVSAHGLKEIREILSKACETISKVPYVLSHRDYHSKNILIVKNKEVALIDFQDALLGPADYDLASLLRDSYVAFEDQEESELLKYYESEAGRKVDLSLFGWVSLQRNLKAIGRFFYIHKVKGRDTHLPYVRPSFKRVKRTLNQIGEKRFLELLTEIFPDDLKA